MKPYWLIKLPRGRLAASRDVTWGDVQACIAALNAASEDVFAGLSLAVSASGARAAYAVHVGDIASSDGVFVEPQSARVPGDYLALAPSTLFLHEKYTHVARTGPAPSPPSRSATSSGL